MKRIKNLGEGKGRKLHYVSLWICIAALWTNQLYHSRCEYQIHQKLFSQNQRIFESLEIQLDAIQERKEELRRITDLLGAIQNKNRNEKVME